MAAIVHILRSGSALCGFANYATPHNWPDAQSEHLWVGADQSDLATCLLCKQKAKESGYLD